MTAQAELVSKAFDQVFETFQKASESTLQMQQDLFRQWTGFWPGFPTPQPPGMEQLRRFHKEWLKTTTELTRKYQELWERQYKAGLESLEKAFKLAEAKDPEELRQKTMELWEKSFECLKELAQAQVRNFQTATEKWTEMTNKATP